MKKKKIKMSDTTVQTIFYSCGIIAILGLSFAVGYIVIVRDSQSSNQFINKNKKEKNKVASTSKINTGIQCKGDVSGSVVQKNTGGTNVQFDQKINTNT